MVLGVASGHDMQNVVVLQFAPLENAQRFLLADNDFNIPVETLNRVHRLAGVRYVKGSWPLHLKRRYAVVNAPYIAVAWAADQ